jgi:hypothetical protein
MDDAQSNYNKDIFRSHPREGAIERDWTNKNVTVGIVYMPNYYAAPKRASIKQKTTGDRIIVCITFPI